ncbi:hypothetical protein ACFY97_18480 [Streptomyces klenkii]|uniref:hypothetical protein n=1 Tax=Streptomyces klenkii TaxID=1420899 RepID=UPI0036ED440B
MTTHNPLPSLGLCPVCQREIRVRKAGTLYAHHCDGDGREPAACLEPTFARWLHAQAARRDAHENRVTYLAQAAFHRCTRSPNRTPADVTWTTAEELHGRRHLIQLARTGSDVLVPYNGERCDWRCRDIAHASEVYDRLVAAREPS